MRSTLMITALVGAVGLTGCASTGFAPYSRGQACGVPTDTIAAVLGTDEFHTRTTGRTLPPTATRPTFVCDVSLWDRDRALSVSADRLSSGQLPAYAEQIAAAPEQFTVAGGTVGIEVTEDGFTGRWTCGEQSLGGTMRIHVTSGEKATAVERRALVTAVAERAGTACPR